MSKAQPLPLAFMSYVRFDDQHEDGRLTEFRRRLSGEVRIQTGEDFPIFQDRNDIKWGQNWEERIINSIDEVTFLIPIITPSFFNSPACRAEVEQFLKREKKLGRNDLILPLYYVGTPMLDDESKRAADNIAQEIAKREYADWRDLRFEPFTSPQVGKTLARLAEQIRDVLNRVQPSVKTTTNTVDARGRQTASEQATSSPQASESGASGESAQGPSAKTEPPTIVVDPLYRGDYTTIGQALQVANPGDRILIRPGLYQESIVIDKPLEIIGDGEPGDVVIQAQQASVIYFKTTMGRISNLWLRMLEGDKLFGVDIAQGRLELEGCDITGQSLSCVGIHDGADPRLRRNRIHSGRQGGVLIYKNGRGTLEDNDIFGNAFSGVDITSGGNPILRHNRIHGNQQGGVFIYENGLGTLEDNDILDNHLSGVTVRGSSNATLRHNRIQKNGGYAIKIHTDSGGVIEDNDLRDNEEGASFIAPDSRAKVRSSRNRQ